MFAVPQANLVAKHVYGSQCIIMADKTVSSYQKLVSFFSIKNAYKKGGIFEGDTLCTFIILNLFAVHIYPHIYLRVVA